METFQFGSTQVYTPSEKNHRKITSINYDELHRLATQYKTQGNMELAITCLMRAKFVSVKETAPDIQRLCRLPLFLQQAGYFEEAKRELQELYDNAEAYAAQNVQGIHQNKHLITQHVKANYLTYLFDKARLIYQREKQAEQAEKLKRISAQYAQQADEIDKKLQAKWEKASKAFETEYNAPFQQGRQSVLDEYKVKRRKRPSHQTKYYPSDFSTLEFWVGLGVVSAIIGYFFF